MVQTRLAVLIALADLPGGQAKLDELDDEAARFIVAASEQIENSERLSALGHIDVFESGLVAYEGGSLQVTEDGWLLLRALGISPQRSSDPDYASTLHSLNLIDDLIGPEARLKILDLEPLSIEQDADPIPLREAADLEARPLASRPTRPQAPEESNDEPVDAGPTETSEVSAGRDDIENATDVPAFLTHKFASGTSAPRSSPPSRLTRWTQNGLNIWRRHLQSDQPSRISRRSGVDLERGLLALLSLLVVVGCAGAVAALTQVRSLKSELAALQRELVPLKERIAKLDQTERTNEVFDKMHDQKTPPSREPRAEEAALVLSREEIQIVRDYIKPAPVVGPSTAPISVGDPVDGPTIPFPSPVTEKVPKLLGARFAIKNGAIVIIRRESRRADAVIGPN